MALTPLESESLTFDPYSFPEELWVEIILRLPFPTLAHISEVCKLFRKLGREDSIWQPLCVNENIFNIPLSGSWYHGYREATEWKDVLRGKTELKLFRLGSEILTYTVRFGNPPSAATNDLEHSLITSVDVSAPKVTINSQTIVPSLQGIHVLPCSLNIRRSPHPGIFLLTEVKRHWSDTEQRNVASYTGQCLVDATYWDLYKTDEKLVGRLSRVKRSSEPFVYQMP